MVEKVLNARTLQPARKLRCWGWFFWHCKIVSAWLQQSKAKSSKSHYELVFPITCICICVEDLPHHAIGIDTQTHKWLLLQSGIYFFFGGPGILLSEFIAITVVSVITVFLIPLGLSLLCRFWEGCYLFSAKFRLLRWTFVGELAFGVSVIRGVLQGRSGKEGGGLGRPLTRARLGGKASHRGRKGWLSPPKSPCALRAGSEVGEMPRGVWTLWEKWESGKEYVPFSVCDQN